MLAAQLIFVLALLQVPVHSLYHKDVTVKTFDTLLDPAKANLLIEFYAPWCGHCQSLAPEYERLGETFAASPDVIVAQVDADKHKKLATRFGVTGFPTLKWVTKGSTFEKAEDVEAERTAEGLLTYINGKTGLGKKLKGAAPSTVTTITDDNFKTVTGSSNAKALVGFFAPWCGHCKAMKPAWEDLSKLYAEEPGIVIGAVDCDAHKDLCGAEKVEGFPSLKYYSSGTVENYESGRKLEDFVTFVNEKTGLDIAPDGGVTDSAGIIDELSGHVETYLTASTDAERSAVLDTCRAQVDTLDETAANKFKYYAKVFAKIAEKGLDYIKTEKARLSKVLETSESLKGGQRRSFLRRINVLKAFAKN